MIGLIGKKMGMTQMYKDNGEVCPATAIELGPCPIVQVKDKDGKDGYTALKIGWWPSEKISKPIKGILAKANVPGMKVFREVRIDDAGEYKPGDVLTADVFAVGERVVVRGTMKGRGFSGVLKRHGFSGGKATHGCRAVNIPGSMGGSSDPSRIFKGKKLPGQFGAVTSTVKGLEVLMVDTEKNVILVKGAVPGSRNGLVMVTKQK